MSWREHIKVHPAADVFPMMSDAELRDLIRNIKQSSGHISCTVWRDLSNGTDYLLDGRNRLDAWEKMGNVVARDGKLTRGPWFDGTTLGPGNDPVATIVALNISRRHLTPKQRVILAAEARAAGKKFGKSVSRKSARNSKRGRKEGRPETIVGEVARDAKVAPNTARKHLRSAGLLPKKNGGSRQRPSKENDSNASLTGQNQAEPAKTSQITEKVITREHDLIAVKIIDQLAGMDPSRLSSPGEFSAALRVQANRIEFASKPAQLANQV